MSVANLDRVFGTFSGGIPMSFMRTRPVCSGPFRSCIPSFGAKKEAVTSAFIHGRDRSPVFESSPEDI